jgi:hypothetical protein
VAERAEANRCWGEMLARWVIPVELIDAAPAPPHFFDPHVFIDAADQAFDRAYDTPRWSGSTSGRGRSPSDGNQDSPAWSTSAARGSVWAKR